MGIPLDLLFFYLIVVVVLGIQAYHLVVAVKSGERKQIVAQLLWTALVIVVAAAIWYFCWC